jgi:hypothetical protein
MPVEERIMATEKRTRYDGRIELDCEDGCII